MTALKVTALVLTAIVLVPSGAHLLELPAKMALDRAAYFTVQQIYAGWSLFGVPIVAAIGANVLLSARLRARDPAAARWAMAAAGLMAASLGVFFAWTFPANRATGNWTLMPDAWEGLRRAWEYSHAANAGIVLAALVACAIAASRSGNRRPDGLARRASAGQECRP
ncbi:hypothetical protein [Stella sp.]|uniref:hypothetical protein n=1 Tax=Stella sp. TaxID=2912054 RepID=UPI0035B3A59E